MKNFFYFFFSVFFLVCTSRLIPLYGTDQNERPKIGVVLSGGGAKGFAHIAVLRALEELNIPVDYIGGTSMGSTVAALYAMGYSVDELEKLARETDWFRYFQNRPERENASIFHKIYFQEYPFTLDISKDGISAPKGFVNGQRIGLFLSRLTWNYQSVKDFREYPIPFLCVATDFEKGEWVVFTSGNIAESLRASMAIPSVFDPVELDGKVYLDGGVVNNFPVSEVKDMGAEIIIGVDVSGRLYKKKDLDSLPKIMEQSISFLAERKTMEQRKLCDILIIPDMHDMGAQDFGRTDEIIKRGEAATLLQMNKLKKLSEDLKKWNIKSTVHTESERDKGVRVEKIYLHGLVKVSKSVIKQYLGIEPGDTITPEVIENAVNRIYGLELFERINYYIERNNGITSLHLNFKESSESHLFLGVAYDTDLKAALLLGLQVNNAGFKNTEFIAKVRMGDYKKLDVSYLFYTNIDPGLWIDANAMIYNLDFTIYENRHKTAVYDFWDQTSSLSFNTFYSNWILLSLGMRKEFYYFDPEIVNSTSRNSYKFDLLSFYVMMRIDTLDDFTFPRKGLFFSAQVDYVRDDFSVYDQGYNIKNFERNMILSRVAVPLGLRFSFQSGFSISTVSEDEVLPSYWFVMGGYQRYEDWIYPLYGYEFMEKFGLHGWVYYLSIQYEPVPDFFITARWNEGKVVDDINELYRYRNTDSAYGVSLGYRSPFGPVQCSIFRKADRDDYSGYFNVGFVF